jgi:hypothetical protein
MGFSWWVVGERMALVSASVSGGQGGQRLQPVFADGEEREGRSGRRHDRTPVEKETRL